MINTDGEKVTDMAHTPGPWTLDARRENVVGSNGEKVRISARDFPISFDTQNDVAAANSNLLLAAPELLEALKLAREVIDGECSCDVCVRLAPTVNAAIAKAEGRRPHCDCHEHDRQVCDVCQGVTGSDTLEPSSNDAQAIREGK